MSSSSVKPQSKRMSSSSTKCPIRKRHMEGKFLKHSTNPKITPSEKAAISENNISSPTTSQGVAAQLPSSTGESVDSASGRMSGHGMGGMGGYGMGGMGGYGMGGMGGYGMGGMGMGMGMGGMGMGMGGYGMMGADGGVMGPLMNQLVMVREISAVK